MNPLNIQQAFEQALAHHSRGELQDAERLYQAILQVQATHPGANHNLGALALQANAPVAALPYLKEALEANPDELQFWLSYADALLQSGQFDIAGAVLARGRERGIRGEGFDALSMRLASLAPGPPTEQIEELKRLFVAARFAEAATLAESITVLFPSYWFGWKALGASYRQIGRSADSVEPTQKAVALAPGDAEAHSNLGTTLRDLGRLEEAAVSCRQALQLDPNSADAQFNLGIVLHQQGNALEALSHFRNALAIAPASFIAQQGICLALDRLVPQWHVPMMNDESRNAAYYGALKSAIGTDSEVFEIGTGSGLLAMMAARLGAKCVVTCEGAPLIAAAAERIIADNGYAGNVRVVSKRSTDVQVGEDLPGKADILVSEIFSSELIGEHVLGSLADAKQRLLKPQGRVIPAAGSIMVALFGGEDVAKHLIAGDAFGFDLRHFNSIVSRKRLLGRAGLDVELLSDDVEAFRFDFQAQTIFPGETRTLRIPVRTPGRCLGVLQWIRLQMDKDLVYENHPTHSAKVSHWQMCAFVFSEPVDVGPGQVAVVTAAHNQSILWFDLDGIAQEAAAR